MAVRPPKTIRGKEADDSMYPVNAKIVDLDKHRGTVNKFYRYVIDVETVDGTKYFIFRRYSEFHTLHERLEERFPIEAGSINMHDRTLPTLPPKKYAGRSAVRSVAEERAPQLIQYLTELLKLPKKISQDELVRVFLRQHMTDDTPYHLPVGGPLFGDFYSMPTSSLERVRTKPKPALPAGPRPSATKSPPSKPTPPARPPVPGGKPIKGPRCQVDYPYTAQADDELTLRKGVTVALLQHVDDNWMQGKLDGKVGLFPTSYVTIIEDLSLNEEEEWDDDDDDKMAITCVVKGVERTVDIDAALVTNPKYADLYRAISNALGDKKIALNYRDCEGDLVMIADDDDTTLLVQEGLVPQTKKRLTNQAPWTLHITKTGDFSPYHVDPYA